MWKLLLLISILPILATLLVRWWFGLRVLAKLGGRECRLTPSRWESTLTTAPLAQARDATAADAGWELRSAALEWWRKHDPRRAKSREGARNFGYAVPPLTAMIAVFAVFLAKIPVVGAISVVIAATALACVFGLLSLGSELRAIAATAHRVRESHVFPRRDDEDAVISCATAYAWRESLPPILRWLQR